MYLQSTLLTHEHLSPVAHVNLGQFITSGHELLFCLSCSCHFGINQFKQMSVALKCRLLLSIWVKPLEIDLGCSIAWDAHVYLGQTITNDYGLLFDVGLLMSIWVKPLEIDMGCSVAHVHLGQTIRNRHGLLGCSYPYGSYNKEIDMGCSVAHVQLGQTIRNRHGLLGCSCPFGSNH